MPLSTVVSVAVKVEPNKLTQFNQQNAATLQAIPAHGVSMGEAVAFLERQANALPAEFSHDWQGIRANIPGKVARWHSRSRRRW